MPNRRKQIILLSALAVVFFYVIYRGNRSPEIAPVVSSADEKFRPIAVENPALRLDLLDRLKKLQYEGSHRNIFSATAPPPASAAAPPPAAVAAQPMIPAVPHWSGAAGDTGHFLWLTSPMRKRGCAARSL